MTPLVQLLCVFALIVAVGGYFLGACAIFGVAFALQLLANPSSVQPSEPFGPE